MSYVSYRRSFLGSLHRTRGGYLIVWTGRTTIGGVYDPPRHSSTTSLCCSLSSSLSFHPQFPYAVTLHRTFSSHLFCVISFVLILVLLIVLSIASIAMALCRDTTSESSGLDRAHCCIMERCPNNLPASRHIMRWFVRYPHGILSQ